MLRRIVLGSSAGLLALAGMALPAEALEFSRFGQKGHDLFVAFQGTIVRGDSARLDAFLATLAPDDKVVGIVLNSPGGDGNEGVRLMNQVGQAYWTALVPSGAVCASACTLLFAAAGQRLAGAGARIGVHNPRVVGGDPFVGATEQVIAEFVKMSVRLNIPAPIVDKMAATRSSDISWLTLADLALWRVTIVNDTATTAVAPAAAAGALAGAQTTAKAAGGAGAADLPTGADASRIQSRLADLGYYDAGVDGIWGPASQKALQDFKAANGLAKDEGWNAATEAALFASAAVKRKI